MAKELKETYVRQSLPVLVFTSKQSKAVVARGRQSITGSTPGISRIGTGIRDLLSKSRIWECFSKSFFLLFGIPGNSRILRESRDLDSRLILKILGFRTH